MTQDLDAKLGRLLREGAPPERDPLFRIRVLERREQRRYQRRTVALLAGSGLILLLAVAVGLVVDVTSVAGMVRAGSITVLVSAVAAAALFSVRGVLQVMHHLRGR
jgi:hypothetical protein